MDCDSNIVPGQSACCFYAHANEKQKEPLMEHLKKTGELAAGFASSFGCEKLGRQLGLLHDVGKHTERFQKVLRHEMVKVDHAIVGAECYAELADEDICTSDFIFLLICHCINAHHTELRGDFEDIGIDGVYPLPKHFEAPYAMTDDRDKLNALSGEKEFDEIKAFVENNQLLLTLSEGDYPVVESMNNAEKMLFVRMLQSCLVDADYSATAMFDDPNFVEMIEDRELVADAFLQKLAKYHEQLVQGSDLKNQMNQLRNQVYDDAAAAAGQPIGFFTLTAPTGTAKTLAMMRFALGHAKKHALKRVVIVLPYLSITSQNAQVYRDIFGEEAVLEDDSTTEYPDEARIYAERWSSPIIVTTSVKFLETLQAARASDLRRLHQLANAVIIFDESQTMPTDMTDISIKTLQAMPRYYGSSIVLSTATQPSYRYRDALRDFHAAEIIRDPEKLYRDYAAAKKTQVQFSTDCEWTAEDLADHFGKYAQAICVSNTTKKALQLYRTFADRYGEDTSLYLSSRLCPAHKTQVMEAVKKRLRSGERCYLLSTQCVEAGVDFDFPAGAREYASMTSVSQTAGRINRNGKKDLAEMLVFRSDQNGPYDFPSDAYRNEADITFHMASDIRRKQALDTNCLKDIDAYYCNLFSGDSAHGHDRKGIKAAEQHCDLQAMAKEYKLIQDSHQCNVIVPYEGCMEEFHSLAECLEKRNYVIGKKELFAHHSITVSLAAAGKTLDFIKIHCHQLSLSSAVQSVPVNWYIADMDEIYDAKTGLKTRDDTDEGGMIDV